VRVQLTSGALVIQPWFPAGARLVRRAAPERGPAGVAGLGTLLGPEETGVPACAGGVPGASEAGSASARHGCAVRVPLPSVS
jgi:hypothetical protein